jgi:MFS superfamily sulfate permease-like transporter
MKQSAAAGEKAPRKAGGNSFDRMEWAGAFGDLGTLVPFVVAYITLLRLDPFGILVAFGVSMIVAGIYYRTPFPVQPMKAIGAAATTQATQTFTVTAGAVYAASLATGVIWLILGVTGLAKRIAVLVARSVTMGIILGLGISFMLEGIKMMADGWIVAAVALALTLLLLDSRRFPVMFLLLVGGAAYQFVVQPQLLDQLTQVRPELRVPLLAITSLTWSDVAIGVVLLALPQMPLTLGNAVVAITEENNRLFPQRPVDERRVAISTGVMNLFSGSVGGVPMCHGAGGMAGHIRFGAHTGGAIVILGVILLALAFFFSASIATLFAIFPKAVLGVILFMTGAQLALGSCDIGKEKDDRFVTLVTAAFSIWNVGLAFVVGMALVQALRRRWVRL